MTNFLKGLFDILMDAVNSMPTLSLDSESLSSIGNALTTVVSWIKIVNFMVPLDTIFLIMTLVIGFRILKFSVFIANWIIRRIADFFP